jgi:hypothetical protein
MVLQKYNFLPEETAFKDNLSLSHISLFMVRANRTKITLLKKVYLYVEAFSR